MRRFSRFILESGVCKRIWLEDTSLTQTPVSYRVANKFSSQFLCVVHNNMRHSYRVSNSLQFSRWSTPICDMWIPLLSPKWNVNVEVEMGTKRNCGEVFEANISLFRKREKPFNIIWSPQDRSMTRWPEEKIDYSLYFQLPPRVFISLDEVFSSC